MRTLTYQDLANLQGLKEIKERLDKYMTVIGELMREIHPSLDFGILFSIENQQFIIEQKCVSYKIQTGFFWDLYDLYFGIKVIITNDLDVMEDLVYDTGWSYGREGSNGFSYYQLKRFTDTMVVGSPTQANIEVLQCFSEMGSDSVKLIQLLERKRSKPTR